MTTVLPEAETAPVSITVAGSPRFFRRLLRRPVAVACMIYLLGITGVAIIAPLTLPWVASQQAGDLLAVREGPSMAHLLGTDSLGRDVLDRLLVGTRPTVVGVAEGLVVVLLVGVSTGLAAGYLGGRVDRVINWLGDLVFSMPALIIALVVLTVFPNNLLAAMVTFGLLFSPSLMRVVRSATLPVREEAYIDAARVAGLSRPYIIMRHVLPQVAGAVIIQASLLAGVMFLLQAGLAVLGLLVPAPAPSWGGMLADGISSMVLQPWLIWPPGIAIALAVLACGMLGDAVRDATAEAWSPPVLRKRAKHAMTSVDSEAPAPADAPLPALLSMAGLTVRFPSRAGKVTVVEDVSLEIGLGEVVGLVGESGCGKSVTAGSILGLLPGGAEVVRGRILFEGRDLLAMSEKELRRLRGREIGLISQEPMISLQPGFRVGAQLAHLVRIHHGLSRSAARARVVELLESVHLPDAKAVARKYPHELSGGMAQRVAIARALAGEPKLLIADEPTTALDVTLQAEILDLLRELQRERGMAILLVTHDWGVVADICQRVVVLYAGQVVERGALRPIFREPLHPYTEALLASNPYNAPDDAELLPTIRGGVPEPASWPSGCHFSPRCAYANVACEQGPIPLEYPVEGRETRCIHYDQLVHTR